MNGANEADNLIRVMRHLPFPVTVVTARLGRRRRGITIGSFTSLSLDPPLISFNVTDDSQMDQLLPESNPFVVHFPGSRQEALCTRFSLPDQQDDEQFDGIELDADDLESPPLLSGVNSRLHCLVENRVLAGDHTIIIGRVIRAEFLEESPAMLYMNGAYRSLRPSS